MLQRKREYEIFSLRRLGGHGGVDAGDRVYGRGAIARISYNIAPFATGTVWYSFLIQRQDTNTTSQADFFVGTAFSPVVEAGYFGGTSNWQLVIGFSLRSLGR